MALLPLSQQEHWPLGPIGTTNPPTATLGSAIDQGSMARLLSINSIDDFAPPPSRTPRSRAQSRLVYEARNNARVILDGTITSVSFLKTDFYLPIIATGDFTMLNIAPGDEGGELDPHGAEGTGNPVGGNVTTNIVDGVDKTIAEWMLYMSTNQFYESVLPKGTNANSTYSAAYMCWHQLDVMGCEFVMPGTYNPPGTFETCDADADADVAYPPGWLPTVVDGTTSFLTFGQYFTGVHTGADGQPTPYTVGDTVTPDAPYFTPSSSNCVTTSTIANNIALASLGVTGVRSLRPGNLQQAEH
ncbi:hypothetical protein C8R47DRAFT_186978 [Mycena vitilis]|nr:hypothetical protein C8R47DRAFT_186978 [Mycena vitilis]